jgi:hypothetical protein
MRSTITLFPAFPTMRYLVCLFVGLIAGALLASIASSAMARRHAWPRSLMTVMQHDLVDARAAARSGQCKEPANADAAARLRLLAGDLERALLPAGTKDRVLSQYAGDMRATLAKWDTGADCARQTEALTAVANACDACHRDYR